MITIAKNIITLEGGVITHIKTIVGKSNLWTEEKAIEVLLRYIHEAKVAPDPQVIGKAIKERRYEEGDMEIVIVDSDEIEEV